MNRARFFVLAFAATAITAGLSACGGSAPSEAPPAPAVAVAAPKPETPPARSAAASRPALLEQELAYGEAKSRNLVGFLAMPADATEPLPALVVIHEWWGLNDEVKKVTRRLGSEGYVEVDVGRLGGDTARVATHGVKRTTCTC